MSTEMIRKFTELIREKSRFKPVRKNRIWSLRSARALKLLELPILPRRTKRNYFRHLNGDYVPLSDILEYMHFSLEDRELGDLFQIKKRKIFGSESFVAWRNPHYVVDYLDPLDYVPTYLSKQSRAMVDVVRLLDRYGVRGKSESNAGDYLYGFPFRADYAVYQLSRVLFIEYDESHHEDGMRDLLVDQAKAGLNRSIGYAYLSIKESSWYSEGGRDYYLQQIATHIEKYHLEGVLAGFRRFNQQAFDAFEKGFGKELFQQLIDRKFGCVLPLSRVIGALHLEERTVEIASLFNQSADSGEPTCTDEDVIDFDEEDEDDESDDEGDVGGSENDVNDVEHLPLTFTYQTDFIEGDEETLLSLHGVVRLCLHVHSEVGNRLAMAATDLFAYSFSRLDRLAPTVASREEHYESSRAISRVAQIKSQRKIEFLSDENAILRKRLADAGLEITTE